MPSEPDGAAGDAVFGGGLSCFAACGGDGVRELV